MATIKSENELALARNLSLEAQSLVGEPRSDKCIDSFKQAAPKPPKSFVDYWRLCEELTIIQASLLIVGEDPGPIWSDVERWDINERPRGYEAVKHALLCALNSGGIKGHPAYEDVGGYHETEIINARQSIVNVESMKSWLKGRGFSTGFFFPDWEETPDYLQQTNHRYAPKLAAAIYAWKATANLSNFPGKSPKQVLLKWLRENASMFDLTDDEGNLNQSAIEEIAKIANWQPMGGAPKTPLG